jgi:hypothetical protein
MPCRPICARSRADQGRSAVRACNRVIRKFGSRLTVDYAIAVEKESAAVQLQPREPDQARRSDPGDRQRIDRRQLGPRRPRFSARSMWSATSRLSALHAADGLLHTARRIIECPRTFQGSVSPCRQATPAGARWRSFSCRDQHGRRSYRSRNVRAICSCSGLSKYCSGLRSWVWMKTSTGMPGRRWMSRKRVTSAAGSAMRTV